MTFVAGGRCRQFPLRDTRQAHVHIFGNGDRHCFQHRGLSVGPQHRQFVPGVKKFRRTRRDLARGLRPQTVVIPCIFSVICIDHRIQVDAGQKCFEVDAQRQMGAPVRNRQVRDGWHDLMRADASAGPREHGT